MLAAKLLALLNRVFCTNPTQHRKYHVMVTTDEVRTAAAVMVWHLPQADMENAIKEHKSGFGLEKLPTQKFPANWAYLLIGQLAFNLLAWFKRLVLPPAYHQATVKTIRHHLLNLAGKIIHTTRQYFLMISDRYRSQALWRFAIGRLAHLPTSGFTRAKSAASFASSATRP